MIYPAERYNLNFDICAIVICALLLLYLIFTKNLRVRKIRSYFWVALCMLLCSSGELAMDIVRNPNGITFSNQMAEFTTFISHISHNSVPYFLTLYFLSLTGLWHGIKKKHFVMISIPEAVLVAVHLIPPVRHLIYYYHGNCIYVRGPLYSIYYVIVAFYVICGIGLVFVKRKSIQKKNMQYVLILCGGYMAGMIISMINTYVRMTNFIQVLVLSSSFFLLENDDSLLDHITGVYNISGLIHDSFPLFHSSYRSYIFSIKLQDINDYRLMVGMNGMNEVFHQIGQWMLSIASEERCFYRVGSGEFTVILYNTDEYHARKTAGVIQDRFRQPWKYSDDEADLTIPAQIWVSSIPDRISTEEQVLAFSESTFNPELPQDQIYVADEMQQTARQMQVNVAIRRAIADNTFEVYYQPIYDTTIGTIHSCEALVRMTDPDLGPVSPEEFIKVSERTGTVSRIGSIVFEKVCQFIAEKKPEQYGMDFIEVNLSPIQCMDQNLPAQFGDIMKKYGIRSSQIVLEITESAVIRNKGRVNSVIQDLQNMGFRFALDDFGTGQANYSYIREFPFSIIKIDKSFLWAAEKDSTDRAVLRNMLGLVKDLKLQTVVEGVETPAQKDHLVENGVEYLQGYYYSRPVPQDQFISYVRSFNAKK